MEQIDLNHVRTFVQLVKSGSFTKAAAQLKQPKSRISRWLATLEKCLGSQLIYRTTRQFQLTETGRFFYERAQGLIEGLDSLSYELVETNNEISGLIKVTAPDDMGNLLLPPILDEFSKQYPKVRFEIHLSQSYVDLVKESIDVALRVGPLKDSSLKMRKVGLVRNIFVATPGFLERYRHYENVEELQKLPFIGSFQQKSIELLNLEQNKKIKVRPVYLYNSNNPGMVVQMVLLGKGIAFVPEFLCSDHIKTGRLVQIFKVLIGEETSISVVMPEHKEASLKVKRFTDFLVTRLKEIF